MKSRRKDDDGADKEVPVAKPMTRQQMMDSASKRVNLISQEFTRGFKFLENHPKSVTVFGSSQSAESDYFYQKARMLCGRIASELKYCVMTGGGPGIMEAANRGAFEAGGQSLGITIKLPHAQITNRYITDKVELTYFFARKVCLSFSAEAFIFFPGGFGTLDELFEILTLVQTEKIQSVPIILFGSEYWKPLEAFIKNELAGRKMIDVEDLAIFTIQDDENKVIEIIKGAPVRNGVEYKHPL